jgi:hypothetical protein
MTHQAINELITASKSLIREGALAERFRELASAAEAELNAIPRDPHLNHFIANHHVELNHRGTITVDGLAYSVELLAGDLVTPPEQWVQILRADGHLVMKVASAQAIKDGKA